ncbi:MAG: hypothetical protein B6I32_05200 [Desulfobacterium sp. 4572_20]|nr:MAG: hypothetical protein B6I32_05200 [Desulfobacterium sp. 4572_20]
MTGKGSELTLQDLGMEGLKRAEIPVQARNKSGFPPIPPTGIDLSSAQESLEKYYIEEALKMAGGNESKAARLLNINHHTFRYRRRKLHIG